MVISVCGVELAAERKPSKVNRPVFMSGQVVYQIGLTQFSRQTKAMCVFSINV